MTPLPAQPYHTIKKGKGREGETTEQHDRTARQNGTSEQVGDEDRGEAGAGEEERGDAGAGMNGGWVGRDDRTA